MYFSLLGLLIPLISTIVCEELSYCSPWLDIEKKLKAHNLHVTCINYESCLGMTCEFHEYGQNIHSSIRVNNCENPPNLELTINSPKLKINQWQKRFYHGENFSVTDNFGGDFELQNVNNTFILGLTLQFHADKSHIQSIIELFPSLRPEIKYSFFKDVSVPLPPCKDPFGNTENHDLKSMTTSLPTRTKILPISTKSTIVLSKVKVFPESNCTIDIESCPENEFCQQLNVSTSAGICICVPGFVWGKKGVCVHTPAVIPSTKSLLLTAILVPIAVIVILVGMVYASIRFRICQKMRRRLRVQVYEHVLLGQEDDGSIDDDDESLNPVV